MTQPQDYVFFLQNKDRLFWGLDRTTGAVVISANPYPLDFSPSGWDDVEITNIRNKKYWAIDRTVSAPFKYVEDGAKILKHIFYTLGVEEQVYLVICESRLDYTASGDDLLDQLDLNPLKIFQFTFLGDIYTGISIKNGIKPKKNGKQTYQLWATSEADLSKLTEYFGD